MMVMVASMLSGLTHATTVNWNLRTDEPSTTSFNLQLTSDFEDVISGSQIVVLTHEQASARLKVTKSEDLNGVTLIRASNNEGDALTLSYTLEHAYGTLNVNEQRFYIKRGSANTLIFDRQTEENQPEIDLHNDMRVPPNKRADRPGIEQMSQQNQTKLAKLRSTQSKQGQSTIRMLFLYSPEFAAGFASANTRIAQLLNYTNSALERSGIDIEFELAHAREVAFDNDRTTSTLLDDVTFARSPFANVEALRDEFAADMVAVLSFNSGNSANGVAWVNGDDPDFAFSSTRLSPRCCDSVFAHELGHNLGSGHERETVNTQANPCSRFNFTGYSCGHGNQNNPSGSWGTMMSRLNSGRVDDVFSNPALDCLGEPCGISQGNTNSADNFASFNISRLLVADFRPDPDDPNAPSGPRQPFDESNLPPIIGLLLDEQ